MPKSRKHLNSAWVDSKSAAAALGCSVRHLANLRLDGLLKNGEHWRDIRRPGGARPTYRWHLKRCQEKMNLLPERRNG